MTKNSSLPAAQNYLNSRNAFRAEAVREFQDNPDALRLVDLLNDYVATTMFLMSGKDVGGIKHGTYIAKLVVSFVRTHFIAIELITHSELVEAATLIRKQFELMARLNELLKEDSLEGLLKRTPNLSNLRTKIKGLYGQYSEIAHSASLDPLQLLGSVGVGNGTMTTVYPTFSGHAHTSLSHAAMCVFEYFLWCEEFFTNNIAGYDRDWAAGWANQVFEAYESMFGAEYVDQG